MHEVDSVFLCVLASIHGQLSQICIYFLCQQFTHALTSLIGQVNLSLSNWMNLSSRPEQWALWKSQAGLQLFISNIAGPDDTWEAVRVSIITLLWMACYQQAEQLFKLMTPGQRTRKQIDCWAAYNCLIPQREHLLQEFCAYFMARLRLLELTISPLYLHRLRSSEAREFNDQQHLSHWIRNEMVPFYKDVRNDFHHADVTPRRQQRAPVLADCFLVLDLVMWANDKKLIDVVRKVGARK